MNIGEMFKGLSHDTVLYCIVLYCTVLRVSFEIEMVVNQGVTMYYYVLLCITMYQVATEVSRCLIVIFRQRPGRSRHRGGRQEKDRR